MAYIICRVADGRIDPAQALGDVPEEPTAYDGWGILPDQYLRRFAGDDGETPEPADQRNLTAAVSPLVGKRRRQAAGQGTPSS